MILEKLVFNLNDLIKEDPSYLVVDTTLKGTGETHPIYLAEMFVLDGSDSQSSGSRYDIDKGIFIDIPPDLSPLSPEKAREFMTRVSQVYTTFVRAGYVTIEEI